MESNCSSHCELKLPCYAQCRCQKHIELTVQHPGAAKDSGFQLWSSHEQNKLHKLVKAARAPQVMAREPEPTAGWPPGTSAPCMCNSGCYLISPVFSQQPAPHVIAVFFNWATKNLTRIGFGFVSPGQWVDTTGIFLGQTSAQRPVLDFRAGIMGWRIPLPWTGCLRELCLSWIHLKLLL